MRKILKNLLSIYSLLFSTLFLILGPIGCGPKLPDFKKQLETLNRNYKPHGDDHEMVKALKKTYDLSLSENTLHFAAKSCPKAVEDMMGTDLIYNIECGGLKVPQNHDSNNTNKYLALGYIKYPKVYSKDKPLLVIEQGGPSDSSILVASSFLSTIKALESSFNILAIEQRATKWTYPNSLCHSVTDYLLEHLNTQIDKDGAEAQILKLTKQCYTNFRKDVDDNAISSYQIAKDKAYAAKYFGFDKFHFYGVSYGTVVGQYLLKFSSDSLDKVILDSPVVLGKNWITQSTVDTDLIAENNFNRLVKYLENNYTLDEAIEKFQTTVSYLNEYPVKFNLKYNNKSIPYQFDGTDLKFTFINFLITSYSDKLLSLLLFYSDYSYQYSDAFLQLFQTIAKNKMLSLFEDNKIMYQSITCREFFTDGFNNYSVDKPNTFLNKLTNYNYPTDYESDSIKSLCNLGLKASSDSIILKDPVSTDIPVLILAGDSDHVTPAENANLISSSMTDVKKYTAAETGHGVFSSQECVNEMGVDFLLKGEMNTDDYCKKSLFDVLFPN